MARFGPRAGWPSPASALSLLNLSKRYRTSKRGVVRALVSTRRRHTYILYLYSPYSPCEPALTLVCHWSLSALVRVCVCVTLGSRGH
jgi:hypothetical protein